MSKRIREPKSDKGPRFRIADSDTEHDADHNAKSPQYGTAESISRQEMRSDSREEVEPISTDDSWREAKKRLSKTMIQSSNAERRLLNDGDKSSRSFGSESARAVREEGSAKGPDDTLQSSYAPVPELAADTGDEADVLEIIRHQWRMIIAIIGVTTILGAAILSLLTPLYTATAELIIEPKSPILPGLESTLPGIGTDNQGIETEVKVLTSGVLLDSVVDRLDLVSDPEFNSLAESPEAEMAGEMNQDQGALQEAVTITRALTKNSLFNRLSVTQVGTSRVISVNATSESADKAALIANTLVDEYFQSQQDSKFQASSETSAVLDKRIADLQAELKQSEQLAERFRSDASLLEAGGTTLISQQLVNLNGQILTAKAATAAAQAELSQLTGLISSSDSSSLVERAGALKSPLVQELRRQQVTLEREIAELSSEYGPAHPRMVQLRADAADLENQISVEVNTVVQGLRNAVRVAAAREADLEREARILTARLGETNEDEIQLRALEREVEANQQLLETLLARQKGLGSTDLIQTGQPDAKVISFATPPIEPSFPPFGISMAGILVVSTIIGFVVACIREIRRRGISTLEQLEAVSQLRALGFVPLVTSRRQRRDMLVSILAKSRRPFAQAMKTLNWQIDEGMPEGAKLIVVTSPIAGEGKTTTAIAIARIKALKGHKTIIVDADIRNPSVHTKLNWKSTTGLTDVIEGASELVDAILPDEESPLQILPAGRTSADALSLVESSAMSSILEELSNQYDYVIVDTPPISAAPDACIISKEADTTILAIRASTTPVVAVKYALRILKRNGGHITGAVLTMVETSRSISQKYGYFGYGYYGEAS